MRGGLENSVAMRQHGGAKTADFEVRPIGLKAISIIYQLCDLDQVI